MSEEQQGHAMSHPQAIESGGRQHVSDAAWEACAKAFRGSMTRAAVEKENSRYGVVLLTVAEHDELVRKAGMSRMEFKLACDWMRAASERDALRAEVERLRVQVAGMTGQAEGYRQVIGQLSERLRKGRDENGNGAASGMDARSAHTQVLDAASASHAVQDLDHASALLRANRVCEDDSRAEHRLGLPQPEGEPVEPMSAKRWRWLP